MSYTPGPWYGIAQSSGMYVYKDIKDKRYPIAEINFWGEETEYNARLIINAPEILAVLEELVKRCDGPEGVQTDGSNMCTIKAHAIISKAKGERL